MKNRFIYNPFFHIAGMKAFLIGFLVLLLTSFAQYLSGTHFYGFNIGFFKGPDFRVYLLENAGHWIILASLLFISGLLFSRSRIRVIDVYATALFSRIPLVITPVIRLIPAFQSFTFQSVPMYTIVLVHIVASVWTVILQYNAFKVSCNLKGEKLVVSFIICLIVAEMGIRFFCAKLL